MKDINHVNLIRLVELYHGKSTLLIVQEHCQSKTLRQHITDRKEGFPSILKEKVSEAFLANLLVQAVRGVAFAHGRGVIHTCITPDNVYLSESGIIKISDFGLSTLLSSPNSPLNYQTPESLSLHPISTPADIYAIGLLVHETSTGKKTFDAKPYLSGRVEDI